MLPFFIDLVSRTDEARRAFETNSKVLEIVANGLPIERYRKFLLELYHIVWNFNPVCAAAASRLTDEYKHVRYFLYEHMHEEKGHETWVLNDLEVVGIAPDRAKAYEPSLWMLGMNGYNYWSAERRHPCSVLGMIYALEIIASVYGGPMTSAIVDSLMLENERGISFISSHATMDTEHLAELRVILNKLEDSLSHEAVIESTIFNFHQFGRILQAI